MSASTPAKPKPSLDAERKNVPGVLSRAGIMQAAIVLAIASFPELPMTMAAFLALIQAAAAAHAATATRATGLVTAREVKVDALWMAMLSIKTYVYALCSTLDAVSAMALIEAAGLVVAGTGKPTKHLFAATYVPATGIVHLALNATMFLGKRPTKKTTFTFSWSTDGGKTWSTGVTTAYASADVPNLVPGTYQFRVFATVGKVIGDPTDPVPLTIR
jgi:hypothetical protein